MKTLVVQVAPVKIGGGNPIVIQSMTNTSTDDVKATVEQFKELADAGSEMVRVTVNTPDAAKAIPAIREELNKMGYKHVPLIGDFHFNGHILLTRFPECAQALDKYRINPGNVGVGDKHDQNFSTFIKIAVENDRPVRIGVNWGSLDQDLFTKMMEENAQKTKPLSDKEVLYESLVTSALSSAQLAEELGLPANKMILSVKMSEVQDCVRVNELLHERCQEIKKMYPLHLGVTEAGASMKGAIASSAALGILLQQGIGDTIRISLTPTPGSKRSEEVEACKLLLQTMDFRFFKPMITSCPGCGRTGSTLYQELAEEVSNYIDERLEVWKEKYPDVVKMKVAVMGCVVNGPGESQHANIGISLPGRSEKPVAIVYKDGKLFKQLKDCDLVETFKQILEEYVEEKY